jgi:hypothetical protein
MSTRIDVASVEAAKRIRLLAEWRYEGQSDLLKRAVKSTKDVVSPVADRITERVSEVVDQVSGHRTRRVNTVPLRSDRRSRDGTPR